MKVKTVTSTAMPLLYLSSVAETLGLSTAEESRARVADAVTRVLARQSSGSAALDLTGDLLTVELFEAVRTALDG